MRRPYERTRFIIRCLEHREIECQDCPQPRDAYAAEYLRSLRPQPRPPREGPSDADLVRAARPIYVFYSGRRPKLGDPYLSYQEDDAMSDIEGELDHPMDDDSSDWSMDSCPELSDGSSADRERKTRTGSWAYLFKPYPLGAVAERLERLGPYGDLRTPVRHRAELRAALAALSIPADYRHGFGSLTIATTRDWLAEDGELLVEKAWEEIQAAGPNPLPDWAEARNTPEFAGVSDGDLWFAIKRQIQTLYSIDDPRKAMTVQFRLINSEFNRDCQGEALGALEKPRRPYRFREPELTREWS
ncbi:hypothetical protein BDP55DRAFT_743919 [Colletotrichum godetiae]|uniref:Uncharacterized protein n=1 Tax=Colletotrichum godetiae TaxID=1209918 RepID=A0AAJ0ANI3_9PEZI|nr:uncharacterized protein BDP55DRAFT_743919 [Colletotrichum godetiae]KAK1675688.1 hypothetical protein BDP55DRAFT_743919 [Colletotrichum godetiae]